MPNDQTDWPRPTTKPEATTDLLIRARGFLERGWCRNAQALDANNNETNPASRQAVAWCAFGALVAAGMPDDYDDRFETHAAFIRLKDAIGGTPVAGFNNAQETVVPVLAAFDRAIAAGCESR